MSVARFTERLAFKIVASNGIPLKSNLTYVNACMILAETFRVVLVPKFVSGLDESTYESAVG
jgi:hypothetical protein